MSDFSVRVVRVASVADHPNADRLSIVRIGGFELISNKVDGKPRYQEGDFVCYIPEDSILPEWLLKRLDMWDEANNKGFLSGKEGNRVKAIRLRGVLSQGVMLPVEIQLSTGRYRDHEILVVKHPDKDAMTVNEGDDVADYLGITKYEPVIPASMAGEAYALPMAMKFDFESIQKFPDMFDPGEPVSVTEKVHGTSVQIGYLQNTVIPEDGFGSCRNMYVTSKGNGAAGRAFKNNEQNNSNTYVRALKVLLDNGLEAKMAAISAMFGNAHVRLFGEIFGQGIQDLSYGLKTPEVRFFDIAIGDAFLPPQAVKQTADALDLPMVPVLYNGPYDLDVLTTYRDGKDSISGSHVREGIVIRAADPASGRKIGKFVSPDYLLRKGATEFN